MTRIFGLLYGLIAYAAFNAVSIYGVGFLGGFLTPTQLDGPATRPLGVALAIDFALLAAFAIQHSGMARPTFKRWWTRIVPASVERSTYVLISSLMMVALYVWWQPIGPVLWRAPDGLARDAVIGLFLLGWAILVYSTFLIDHFDLLGLKQVWGRLTGAAPRVQQLHTPSLYRLVRHPLYVGWLTIFWAAPIMTVAHLVFSLGTTAYILVAIQLEERNLVDEFGAGYIEYRRRTPMLIPRLWPRREPRPTVVKRRVA